MRLLSQLSGLAHMIKPESNSHGREESSTAATSRSLSSYYYSSDSYLAPRHIFWQIVTLQLIYYGIGLLLILFTCMVAGRPPFSLKLVFSWSPVRHDTTVGWTLVMLWLLDTIFSVIALTVVVGRSKLALDFTLTLHGINLVVCWIVEGSFPTSGLWWGLQFTSIILMVSLGTWSSQWRELRNTFFSNVGLDTGGSRPRAVDEESFIPPASSHPQHHATNPAETALLEQYNEYELTDLEPSRMSTSSVRSVSREPAKRKKSTEKHENEGEEETSGETMITGSAISHEDDNGDLSNLLK
ncbi:uncharacterized protein SAPINGB_P001360 [Magnusiomyces paraingens]|uniref:Protein SYS1 n=1 Tax=Magnusiomyces paraingens TaxID=2606893 RepID=A0A5E8B5C1_9ASCO|nr:uncharacterized protein SAPINGB_P001360 [Saprochaete ingens]VVT46734.1 unnamed protein product [Saprochaete ingens]